jgi:hypothetical protein
VETDIRGSNLPLLCIRVLMIDAKKHYELVEKSQELRVAGSPSSFQNRNGLAITELGFSVSFSDHIERSKITRG